MNNILENIEFKPLSSVALGVVIEAFQQAFSDYAVSFSDSQIESMLMRRGYSPALSVAAFDRDRIVAFILNGYGIYNGVKACYDCGTGTLPDYRSLGLAGKLFSHVLPLLREEGVEEYILEVLTSNPKAISLYEKAGFDVVANYNCYNQEISRIVFEKPLRRDIELVNIDGDELYSLRYFCDFAPSWQNDVESIRRGMAQLNIIAAKHCGETIGYCVYDPVTGDISQIAVDHPYRRCGVGTALLKSILRESVALRAKVLNVDAGCVSMMAFLDSLNFNQGLSQFAMRKSL